MAVTREQQRLAAEATRLLNEPLLAEAFAEVRMDALIALSEADAGDMKGILRLQAIATCLSDVRDLLYAKITASGQADGGVQVETPPTA
jgi:hypothetical protein